MFLLLQRDARLPPGIVRCALVVTEEEGEGDLIVNVKDVVINVSLQDNQVLMGLTSLVPANPERQVTVLQPYTLTALRPLTLQSGPNAVLEVIRLLEYIDTDAGKLFYVDMQ